MTSKIDFLNIITSHCDTLRVGNDRKLSRADLFLFYAIPLGAAIGLICATDKTLTSNAVNFLATIFSIFVGLLLNLLVLIIGLAPKQPDQNATPTEKRRYQILHETFANISYAILISVLLIVVLFVSKLTSGVWLTACAILAFTMVGNFLLTLLMVLKRVHNVLTHDLQRGAGGL